MKSICFFCAYYTEREIPFYVKIYLEELNKHFSEVVLLTNEKQLTQTDKEFLLKKNISLRLYKNEGFDFGMWYKAFLEFPVLSYDRIGLVNDSCILFKKLDFIFEWINKNNFDYCGITDSNAIEWHLQSYFLVINKNAIKYVNDYFLENKLKNTIKEVISQYEVGLSSYLSKNKLNLKAYYSNHEYKGEHNPMLYFSDKLIRAGIPLVKKKIIFGSFSDKEFFSLMRMNFNVDPLYHIKLIEEVNKQDILIDFNKIISDIYTTQFKKRLRKYKIKLFIFQILRKFKFWK